MSRVGEKFFPEADQEVRHLQFSCIKLVILYGVFFNDLPIIFLRGMELGELIFFVDISVHNPSSTKHVWAKGFQWKTMTLTLLF